MDLVNEAIELLKSMIATPSLSKEEDAVANLLTAWLHERGVETERLGNNVVARHRTNMPNAPTLLLNSHYDTVKAAGGWTLDPHTPVVIDGRLHGLGSNDAGAPFVTLLAAFLHLRQYPDLSHDVVFAATAEEEISGSNGMEMLARDYFTRKDVGLPALAIIGEPTGMNMAIAEKGLIVLDCTAHGRTGHAARDEGVNAIYAALADMEWFRTYEFERTSAVLGNVKMTVTQINAGTQHNVVPGTCTFVVDVRNTDVYTNEEIVDIIRQHVQCDVVPRSMRLRPSSLPHDHPLVAIGRGLGLGTYGSPTMSDQPLLPAGVPSLKIGSGESARSHTPDEYVMLDEITTAIPTMISLLEQYLR